MSISAFRRSAIFADYYRRICIDHVMALPLRIDAANVVSVVFNRRGTDFADRERALVDMLRRPLAALYRGIAAREEARRAQASLEAMAARAGWHRARVSEAGRIADLSGETARLVRRFFGEPIRASGEAPQAIQEWLRQRSRHWGLESWRRDSVGPLMVRRGGARLTIHFIADPLRPSAASCSCAKKSRP